MGHCRGLLSYGIHIFIHFLIKKLKINFLRFVLIPNFCSEILRKALFLESHRNFLRVREPATAEKTSCERNLLLDSLWVDTNCVS